MREIFFKFIDDLDESYTKKFQVDGFDIWPIIRNRLFFIAISGEYKSPPTKKNSRIQSIKILFKIISRVKLLFRKVDVLGIGRNTFRANLDGLSYDKSLDPILDLLETKKSLIIEINNRPKAYYKSTRILPLNFVERFFSFFYKKDKVVNDQLIKELELKELIRKFIEIKKDVNPQQVLGMLSNDIYKFLLWIKISKLILRSLKPKLLITYTFSSVSSSAFIAVSNSMGIKTIDVQHGPVGKNHHAYRYLTKKQDILLASDPMYYFIWDNNTFEEMKEIVEEDRLIITNNFWHQFIFSNIYRKERSESFDLDRTKILYTLQPIKPLIDSFIFEAIKNSPSDFIWFIRFHPRMNKDQIDEIMGKLKSFIDSHQVIIDFPNDVSLPEILINTDIHLTKFSGSTIDAYLMGVPTIIIDSLGFQIYKKFEKSNLISFELTASAMNLLKRIEIISNDQNEGSVKVEFKELRKAQKNILYNLIDDD